MTVRRVLPAERILIINATYLPEIIFYMSVRFGYAGNSGFAPAFINCFAVRMPVKCLIKITMIVISKAVEFLVAHHFLRV